MAKWSKLSQEPRENENKRFHLEDWFTSENIHPFYEIMILSLF